MSVGLSVCRSVCLSVGNTRAFFAYKSRTDNWILMILTYTIDIYDISASNFPLIFSFKMFQLLYCENLRRCSGATSTAASRYRTATAGARWPPTPAWRPTLCCAHTACPGWARGSSSQGSSSWTELNGPINLAVPTIGLISIN